MSLSALHNEILIRITTYLSLKDTNSLLKTSKAFFLLLTPHLHLLAVQDKDGLPALSWAAEHGHEPLVRFLLEKGVDVNALDSKFNISALYRATTQGHEKICRLLLGSGADLNIKDVNGNTAIHQATKRGFKDIVGLLIEHNADINGINYYGETPLHLAIHSKHRILPKRVMGLRNPQDRKPYITKYGKLRLSKSAEEVETREPADIVNLLLADDIDIHAREDPWETILHTDAETETLMVEFLLSNKADIECKDSSGWTALHRAIVYGCEDVISVLISSDADTNAKNNRLETPLHLAVQENRISTVEPLLLYDADINAQDISGNTPLHHAAFFDCTEIFRLLLENNADTKIHNYGETALGVAARKANPAMVDMVKEGLCDRMLNGMIHQF